ncbi:MAG: S8 family serine peptidase [Lutibacter sp.]
MKRIIFGLLIIALFFNVQQINAQKKEDIDKIKSTYNLEKLSNLEKESRKRNEDDKQKADSLANQKGWEKKMYYSNGSVAELQRISEDNKPIYFITFNTDASKSTRTNYLNTGGSLGLTLDGKDMTAHVWDAGVARSSHQEYDGLGGANRYSIGDNTTTLHFHSAHVTGTIIASGVQVNAKGMAPQSKVIGYNWNSDESEAVLSALNGMLISNHSYGLTERDPGGQPLLPNYYFGAYITESKNWDEIMFNAPYYLMVVAAGNSGNDNTVNGAPLNGFSAYDKLTGHSTSKNNLVVANAQDANISSDGNLITATINSTSSEGPTDDLRIKPDITGNGTSVYSTYEFSDSAYGNISGTSMATPNVTGSLLLLQEHWYNLNSSYMKSATLKGLALHTADDLGSTGPDAIYGWGMLNSKKAAETITSEGNESKIDELTLNSGNSYTFTVDSDGVNPLIASISWTDRAGIATTQLNSTTPILVNDLDIKVFKSEITYYPYRLESVTTTGTGDNSVDPFELVNVNNASGSYTITISHKGTLTGGNQNYSLIVTGISNIEELLGSSTICGSSIETYTLENVNPNTTTDWQLSSNLKRIGASNTSIGIQPLSDYSSESAWVSAYQLGKIKATKSIWLNKPLTGMQSYCEDVTQTTCYLTGITSYVQIGSTTTLALIAKGNVSEANYIDWEWQRSSGDFIFVDSPSFIDNPINGGQGSLGKTASLQVNGSGLMIFKARTRNSCGWGDWKYFFWDVYASSSSYSLNTYLETSNSTMEVPVQVDYSSYNKQLKIEILDIEKWLQARYGNTKLEEPDMQKIIRFVESKNNTVKILIYNFRGEMVLDKEIINTEESISLSQLRSDIYFIKITLKGLTDTKTIYLSK